MNTTISNAPGLDTDYALTQQQIDQYKNNGHVLCRGLASPGEYAESELNPVIE